MPFPMITSVVVGGFLGIAVLPFVVNIPDASRYLPDAVTAWKYLPWFFTKPDEPSSVKTLTVKIPSLPSDENLKWVAPTSWFEKATADAINKEKKEKWMKTTGSTFVGAFLISLLISHWIEEMLENLLQHPTMRHYINTCLLATAKCIKNLKRKSNSSRKQKLQQRKSDKPLSKVGLSAMCGDMASNHQDNGVYEQVIGSFQPKTTFHNPTPDNKLKTFTDLAAYNTACRVEVSDRITSFISSQSPRILPRSIITASGLLTARNESNKSKANV